MSADFHLLLFCWVVMAYSSRLGYIILILDWNTPFHIYCCQFRAELVSLRSERDKAVLEADFARDRLNGFTAELEHQVLCFKLIYCFLFQLLFSLLILGLSFIWC